ncbi:hypothetical protein [Niallia sp. 01092]|uniref:hypothetical protein n=1 Tax=unclassified Niallia TaxID=2837522 RepID=UPI003FD02BC3
MNFKDQLKKDLGVFFNNNEFGEEHNVNGVVIDIIVEDDDVKERSRVPVELYNMTQANYVESKTLYIKCEDMDKPEPDETIFLDGVKYKVDFASEDNGMLSIHISAYRS